ncbi:MAG: FKBP-type peptidyl-prolyl cis-trans isomerase SlyD [Patiriisocius sp.]|jgi:FKBP-type peptidyl-prolyl cis-trans isomerase SlyD
MKIAPNQVVSIDYELKNDDGEVLDSSAGQEPLTYLHGTGGLIPGLEKALEGKAAEEELEVTIPPEEAYGEFDDTLVQKVTTAAFEGVEKVEPGMQFQAQGNNGELQSITIVAVEGDDVTIDANHPLAGQTLHFAVQIRNVREATDEEKDHGHAH